jgi:hypothetical protein
MPKKKKIATRTLKDCLPNLPLETGKAQKKIKDFFIATILCFPDFFDNWIGIQFLYIDYVAEGLHSPRHSGGKRRPCNGGDNTEEDVSSNLT